MLELIGQHYLFLAGGAVVAFTAALAFVSLSDARLDRRRG